MHRKTATRLLQAWIAVLASQVEKNRAFAAVNGDRCAKNVFFALVFCGGRDSSLRSLRGFSVNVMTDRAEYREAKPRVARNRDDLS